MKDLIPPRPSMAAFVIIAGDGPEATTRSTLSAASRARITRFGLPGMAKAAPVMKVFLRKSLRFIVHLQKN